MKNIISNCAFAIALLMAPVASGAEGQKSGRQTALSANGDKLCARYAATLAALRAEIVKAVPKVDEQKKATFLKAYEDEAVATAAERDKLLAQGYGKVEEAVANAYRAAQEALALAETKAAAQAKAILTDIESFLASEKLDAQLVKYVVLSEATPHGLAEFAQHGKEEEALVGRLLADAGLMKEMLSADGASGGKYGQAIKIYTDIQKASANARNGTLRRLALAVSLEHAVPVAQDNPNDQPDGPATVDPVKRYLHFEMAFLDGELDPGFKDLSV